jgi:hypothetical protein
VRALVEWIPGEANIKQALLERLKARTEARVVGNSTDETIHLV